MVSPSLLHNTRSRRDDDRLSGGGGRLVLLLGSGERRARVEEEVDEPHEAQAVGDDREREGVAKVVVGLKRLLVNLAAVAEGEGGRAVSRFVQALVVFVKSSDFGGECFF